MWRELAFLMVFLMGTAPIVSGQTSIKMETRTLLIELGNMLAEIPETKEECQTLLKRIKVWQQEKLKELEVPTPTIHITEPKDEDLVPQRPDVKGIVAHPNAKVWVIVHPTEVSDFWVQPSVTVKGDGTWKVKIHIGRPGSIDVDKQFEIMAVANPKVRLSEGKALRGWPEAQWKSQVIEVTRK